MAPRAHHRCVPISTWLGSELTSFDQLLFQTPMTILHNWTLAWYPYYSDCHNLMKRLACWSTCAGVFETLQVVGFIVNISTILHKPYKAQQSVFTFKSASASSRCQLWCQRVDLLEHQRLHWDCVLYLRQFAWQFVQAAVQQLMHQRRLKLTQMVSGLTCFAVKVMSSMVLLQ